MTDKADPILDDIVKRMNLEISLFPEIQRKRKFKKFATFSQFIEDEYNFWRQYQQSNMMDISAHFQKIKDHLQRALSETDPGQKQGFVGNAVSMANQNQFPCVYSDTAMGKFLAKMHKRNSMTGSGAYDFLSNTQLNQNHFHQNKLYLRGVLLAFHFRNPGVLKDTIDSERESLENIKAKHEDLIGALTDQFDQFVTDTTSAKEQFTKDLTEWQESFKNDFNTWRDNSQNSFDENIESKNQNFDQSSQEWKSKIESLEKLYGERLRLEGPAKYWKDFETDYEKRGETWRLWAIGTGGVFVLFGSWFLMYAPDWFTAKLSVATIRGAVEASRWMNVESSILLIIAVCVP